MAQFFEKNSLENLDIITRDMLASTMNVVPEGKFGPTESTRDDVDLVMEDIYPELKPDVLNTNKS